MKGEIPEIYHIFALFDPSDMGNVMIPKWEPDLTLALPAGYKRFMQNSPQTWRTQHQAHKKLEVKQNKTHTHTTWMTPCFPPNSSRFFSDFKHKKSQQVPGSCNSCSLRWRSFNFARSECLKASGPDSRKSRWWTLGHSTWRLLENPLVTFHRKYNDSTSNARCFIASHVI